MMGRGDDNFVHAQLFETDHPSETYDLRQPYIFLSGLQKTYTLRRLLIWADGESSPSRRNSASSLPSEHRVCSALSIHVDTEEPDERDQAIVHQSQGVDPQERSIASRLTQILIGTERTDPFATYAR
jgi:hypothetical protein